MVLSEEGKFVNKEDATGAALEAILVAVADCKSSPRQSDQWVLQRWAWNEYDPSFFHITTVCHQNASENRPIGTSKTEKIVDSFPYAPFPPEAHDAFVRLRRDITAESNIVSILYRVLHVHCHDIQDESKFKPDVSIYHYNRL